MGSVRRTARERGQATLEMVGIIPIFMLVLGAIIQLFLVGYAAVAAESTARHAAREASLGSSPDTAEARALSDAPRIFDARVNVQNGNQSVAGDEPGVSSALLSGAVSAKATFTVPFLGIGVDHLNLHVTRYAVLPRTE
jgi:Flp pilus assembly protein TadG